MAPPTFILNFLRQESGLGQMNAGLDWASLVDDNDISSYLFRNTGGAAVNLAPPNGYLCHFRQQIGLGNFGHGLCWARGVQTDDVFRILKFRPGGANLTNPKLRVIIPKLYI